MEGMEEMGLRGRRETEGRRVQLDPRGAGGERDSLGNLAVLESVVPVDLQESRGHQLVEQPMFAGVGQPALMYQELNWSTLGGQGGLPRPTKEEQQTTSVYQMTQTISKPWLESKAGLM